VTDRPVASPGSAARPTVGAGKRQLGWLAVGLFVVAYGTNVSTPFLVLYRDRLDLTSSETMAIFVVYVGGILLTLLFAGPASDRFGRRPVVLPMIVLSAGASLVMIAGRDSFLLLLLGRLLLGVVSGGVLGVGAAWLLESMGPGRELRAAVMTTVVTFGGFGIGPPVSAAFEALLPHPLVLPFVVHAVLTVMAAVGVATVPETRSPRPGLPLRATLGVPRADRRSFLTVVVPAAVWVFCFPSTAFALFPVLISDSIDGGEVAVAAGAGMLTAWAGMLARPLVGRVGPASALPLGMVSGVAGYALGWFAFTAGAWPVLLVASALLGLAAGTLTAGALGLLGAMDAGEQRGALTSTFYLLAYPGMAMPLLITSLAAVTSLTFALGSVTALAAGSAVLSAVTARRPSIRSAST
jgi:MFS family permease